MKPKIERFEDLLVWQKSRLLVREVYRVTSEGPFSRDFGLARQSQRAAVSIMANIAEGFDRGNRAEFHQFLVIAKASCAELRSHLYIALDVGYFCEDQFNDLFHQTEEVGRILAGLRTAVARQRNEQKQAKSNDESQVLSPEP